MVKIKIKEIKSKIKEIKKESNSQSNSLEEELADEPITQESFKSSSSDLNPSIQSTRVTERQPTDISIRKQEEQEGSNIAISYSQTNRSQTSQRRSSYQTMEDLKPERVISTAPIPRRIEDMRSLPTGFAPIEQQSIRREINTNQSNTIITNFDDEKPEDKYQSNVEFNRKKKTDYY